MSFTNTITIQRLCALTNLVLLTIGAYFGVTLLYQLIGLKLTPAQSLSQPAPNIAGEGIFRVQPISHYNPVLERDLFRVKKTSQSATASPSMNLEDLEKTQLNLKLWGTVSGDPQKAYAVIEDTQKREQNLYRTGDALQNATIKTILREKVILNVDGKDEVLSMEENAQQSPSMIASRGRPYGSPASSSTREQRITLQRSMLNESFADVNKLMTQIAISPHLEDGQPAGLSLSRIAPNSIFRRMGLRNGDVLLGVNGQQIQSTDDALRMYESLKSSNEVQLQLKRRGRERTVHYYIQ
jgi:general secretion pathway protein C